MSNYRIISSDSHIIEPADLWTDRIESKYKDRAPHVVRDADQDRWFTDGIEGLSFQAGAQAGTRFDEPEKLAFKFREEDVRPGGYIPEEHVKDMDIDGIDVGIVYPTYLQMYAIQDSDLLTAIFRAYNSWVADFCGAYPKRLRGIAMLNTDDIHEAVGELEAYAKMGLAGAMISVFPPEDRSYDSPEYDPLWAASQDLDIPLSLHTGTNRPAPGDKVIHLHELKPSFLCNVDSYVRSSLADMIYSGVFERYPKLQIGSIEFELSWVPHFLNRLDFNYSQRPPGDKWHRYKEDMMPSDYFHRNVFISFQEDSLGIELRHIIGVDNLLWGSDYPHQESTFPYSRRVLDEILADCTDEEKAKIAGGNAARIYHLD